MTHHGDEKQRELAKLRELITELGEPTPPPSCSRCKGPSVLTSFLVCGPCRQLLLPGVDCEPHPPACYVCTQPLKPLYWCSACEHFFHV